MTQLEPDAFCSNCPTRHILTRLAEKWTILTLAALCEGPMRFGALRRRIEGVSQKMLTKTLRNLERDGLVSRTVHDQAPLRVEYRLTPLGASCAERVSELKSWAETRMTEIIAATRPPDATS